MRPDTAEAGSHRQDLGVTAAAAEPQGRWSRRGGSRSRPSGRFLFAEHQSIACQAKFQRQPRQSVEGGEFIPTRNGLRSPFLKTTALEVNLTFGDPC